MIDGPLALVLKQSLLRHLWYLTQHLVILSLFDQSMDSETKETIAMRLFYTPRPHVFAPGKPEFPKQAMEGNQSMVELVGPQSWLLFNLIGANGAWLTMPCNQWPTAPEFIRMKVLVQNLAVVNDIAERGIKDIQEYAEAAMDGAYRGQIILVSNSHRLKLQKMKWKNIFKYFISYKCVMTD